MNPTHQYVGEIPLLDANTLYSDHYHVFNTRMGYKKQLSNKISFGADVGINNILNTTYAQSVLINTTAFGSAEPRFFYPGNGINYYGSIQLKYHML
jgi:iron complex outermembrane receptor protein